MSKAIELSSAEEALEYFFEQGWTDGLPVIPPTPKRVRAMLAAVKLQGEETVGSIQERNVRVNAEMVAIHAVMSGCLPAYMPVVLAAAQAVLDPAFRVHGVTASTGGASILIIVNGPIISQIGLNSGKNIMGTGNRANATIGRAIHLLLLNTGKTSEFDQSTMGHPGKFTFCIAESESDDWQPLHVEKGFQRDESTVTVLAAEGPNQINNHVSDTGEGILLSIADRMTALATFNMQRPSACCLVICPEHRATLVQQGWDKSRIRTFLFEHARRPLSDAYRFGLRKKPLSEGEVGSWVAVKSPDDILLVAGGGPAGRFSAYIPNWGSLNQSQPVTKLIQLSGLPSEIKKSVRPLDEGPVYDVVVVGAGPAGMSAAIGLSGANLKILMIDYALPGGQMLNISEVENFPGKAVVSGPEFANTMFEQAEKLGVEYMHGKVEEVLEGFPFKTVKLSGKTVECKAVVVATGSRPRQLGIRGELRFQGLGVSYCAVCDGAFFKGKEVVIIGGGDSALDEAFFLKDIVKKVTIIHRRSEFRAQVILQKRIREAANVHLIINHTVEEIIGQEQVEAVLIRDVLTGRERELPCSGVFVYVGMVPRPDCVEKLGLTNQGKYITTDETMSTHIPGIFAIGDIREKPLRLIATAVGDGCTVVFAVNEYLRKISRG